MNFDDDEPIGSEDNIIFLFMLGIILFLFIIMCIEKYGL